MKALNQGLALLVVAVASGAAYAQFVKGNEAVRVLPDGTKKVDVPPLPSITLPAPCPAATAGCAGGGWKMLESPKGLVECTELYARPSTCRPSTYGIEKRSRTWIVKVRGEWLQCARPTLSGTCVSLKSLPYSAVQ